MAHNFLGAGDVLTFEYRGQLLNFKITDSQDLQELGGNFCQIPTTHDGAVNIFASGPSIKQTKFDFNLLSRPSIFVNGSLSLLSNHKFEQPIAYVITDARFVGHNLSVIVQYFQSMFCFFTLPVLQALLKTAPHWVIQHASLIRLIYNVERPIINNTHLIATLVSKFIPLASYQLAKLSLDVNLTDSFVFDQQQQPIIGVSLDISQGFVEAGTVTFVAAQLAFSLGARQIHIFGMDLSNTKQPRFYETKQNQAPSKLDKAIENRIVPSFELLAKVYRQYNCQTYNHSVLSKDLFSNLVFTH